MGGGSNAAQEAVIKTIKKKCKKAKWLSEEGLQTVGYDWATELTDLTEWSSGFPYFLQLKSEFSNKEFMIWATVSSRSCFCWLYRASPSLAAMNIIWFQYWLSGDVQVLSLLLSCCKRVFAMTSVFSWQNSLSLCPASFCTPRPDLPVTIDVSWLPTFAFQFPIMKRTSILDVSSKRSCRSS